MEYSIKRIIKNYIGYSIIKWYVLVNVFILVFFISMLILKEFDLLKYVINNDARNYGRKGNGSLALVFLLSPTLMIFFIIKIIKIKKYFKFGISTIATIREFIYDDNETVKGIKYYYEIDGEIYNCDFKFVEKDMKTEFKKNKTINVLYNPKNRNDSIPVDI